jgi:hypothetical protein
VLFAQGKQFSLGFHNIVMVLRGCFHT